MKYDVSSIRAQKWLGIIGFAIYLAVQITLSGFIVVSASDVYYLGGFSFSFTSEFQLAWYTAASIFVLSLVFSYGLMVLDIYLTDSYDVIGDDSILHEVNRRFFDGRRPESYDQYFTDDIKEYLTKKSDTEFLFKKLEVGYIVVELMEKYNITTVSKVLLTRTHIPNAFTFKNFLPSKSFGTDWVVVHSNLCEILTHDELVAVLAHELAHIRNDDSALKGFMHSPFSIINVAWLKIYADMFLSIFSPPVSTMLVILRVLAFGIFYLLISGGMALLGIHIVNFISRRMELLADYGAAGMVGGVSMTNAIIKLGQRGEVLSAIEEETNWIVNRLTSPNTEKMVLDIMHYIDPDEMSIDEARKKTMEYVITHIMKSTFDAMKLNRFHQKRTQLINASLTELQKERNKTRPNQITSAKLTEKQIESYLADWQELDENKNYYLEEEEIANLVSELKNNDKQVFRADVLSRYNVLLQSQTHPAITDRINFLYLTTIQRADNTA